MNETRALMQLANGKVIDIFDFQVARDFDPLSVARSLSKLNRFTGHTKHPYSVAQHCLLVAAIMRMLSIERFQSIEHVEWNFVTLNTLKLEFAGLLHDASEHVFGDIASPLKSHPSMRLLAEAERKLSAEIMWFHGIELLRQDLDQLHRADRLALSLEADKLMDTSNPVWKSHMELYPISDLKAEFLIRRDTPENFEASWLSRYYQLKNQIAIGGKSASVTYNESSIMEKTR